MRNDIYNLPLPEKKLVDRFRVPFKKITSGYSATVVTLPHTGRTSHLRALTSRPDLLSQLGVTDEVVVFIDPDKSIDSYNSFLSESIRLVLKNTSQEVTPDLTNAILSQDSYLLATSLLDITAHLSKNNKLLFVITVKKSTLRYLEEIDNIVLQMQKQAQNNPITLLWSIDSYVLRNYKPGHPSSTLTHRLYFQKTFDEEESLHSLIRSALSKGKIFPESLYSKALELTGGIAAFSHQITNVYSDGIDSMQLKATALSTNYSKDIITSLKNEYATDPDISTLLTTKDSRIFIQEQKSERIYLTLTFKEDPTAQDLLLGQLFSENLHNPIARDTVAKTLWGNDWQKHYSDWALDKAISRLRAKIQKTHKLITIKNFGYQLIKI